MFIYDIARDAWKKCRHSFKARIGHAVHCYKNKLFILGDSLSTNRRLEFTSPQLEVYDIEKDRCMWTSVFHIRLLTPLRLFIMIACM